MTSLLYKLAARSGVSKALHLQCLTSNSLPAVASRSIEAVPNRLVTSGSNSCRGFATLAEHQREVDAINEKFVEARDEIEYAMEDAETVYFNESAEDAKEAVSKVLDRYQALLGKLDPQERGKLERSMGLKMEQLKAELAQLDTLHAD